MCVFLPYCRGKNGVRQRYEIKTGSSKREPGLSYICNFLKPRGFVERDILFDRTCAPVAQIARLVLLTNRL